MLCHYKHTSIIVQRDAKQSSLFIILQVHSTPPSRVATLAWSHWREVAAQKI